MGEDTQAPEGAFPLQACGDRRVKLDVFPGRPQNELPGMQDPRFISCDFKLLRKVALVLRRVNISIFMVIEDPEEPV